MSKRGKKWLALLLSASMVFSLNTFAFANEEIPDAAGKQVKVQAADPDEAGGLFVVPEEWNINSDPSKWTTATKLISFNGVDPIVIPRHDFQPSEYYYYKASDWYGEIEFTAPSDNVAFNEYKKEIDALSSNGIIDVKCEEVPGEDPDEINLSYTVGLKPEFASVEEINRCYDPDLFDAVVSITGLYDNLIENRYYYEVKDPYWSYSVDLYEESESATPYYSPFSYFFDYRDHVIDGKASKAELAKDDENWVYRAVDAGDGLFVLVRYRDTEDSLGAHYFVNTVDEKGAVVTQEVNSRYQSKTDTVNPDEPVVTYSAAKHEGYSLEAYGDEAPLKKNVESDIVVDAVLVKHDATQKKTVLVRGLTIKKIAAKNNVAATVPELGKYVVNTDEVFGNLDGAYGYSPEYDETGTVKAYKYTGFTSAPQFTKNENKNFKAQPYFTIAVDCVGDAKQYKKNVTSVVKKEKFNFEIAQLNIGSYDNDMIEEATIPYTETVAWDGTAESLDKAEDAFAANYEKKHSDLVKEYIPAFKELYPNDFKRYQAENPDTKIAAAMTEDEYWTNEISKNHIKRDFPSYIDEIAEDRVTFAASTEISYVPLYVDPEVDQYSVSQWQINKAHISKMDVKLDYSNKKGMTELKFADSGKSSLKLYLQRALCTMSQTPLKSTYPRKMDENGPDTDEGVYKTQWFLGKVKTGKEGSNADAVVTDSTYTETDELAGEVSRPFVLIKGQNNLTGAVTMRLIPGVHGYTNKIGVGHFYKDEFFYIDSVD